MLFFFSEYLRESVKNRRIIITVQEYFEFLLISVFYPKYAAVRHLARHITVNSEAKSGMLEWCTYYNYHFQERHIQ